MSTIYDVANCSGVSKSTVSLVLNNSELVKPATRDKVLEAIRDLNYVPNQNARGLSSKKTNCIGIIIMRSERHNPDEYGFDQHVGLYSYNIATGIMDEMLKTKYGVFMERFCSVASPGELPMLIKTKRVDGAIIIGSPYDKGMIEKLQEMKFPFGLVGVDSNEDNIDCVTADPCDGVRIGLRYLWEKGHRNICFINCPPVFKSSYLREEALYSEAKGLGLKINPDLVVKSSSNDGKSAYQEMKKILDSGAKIDGLMAANDHLAIGAMRYIIESGLRVPEDVSVFGYVDSSIAGYCIPALTTVNIHKEQMGMTAANLLMERLENPQKKACTVSIPADIVIRKSVIDRNV